jgi:hypothetical protein
LFFLIPVSLLCRQNLSLTSEVVLPPGSVISALSGPLNVIVTGATLALT